MEIFPKNGASLVVEAMAEPGRGLMGGILFLMNKKLKLIKILKNN
jgi:hypothetical protein